MGKQVVQVKLLPTLEQAEALAATLRAVNEAANWTSQIAFARGVRREYALRQHTYTRLKAEHGLGSQVAQLVIKKTCHAYATIAALIKAGRLQGKRASKATAKPVSFRADAAQAFDDRCLSWQNDVRPSAPGFRSSLSTPDTPRGGDRGAGTPRRPTGLPEIISPVSVADSLGPPTR